MSVRALPFSDDVPTESRQAANRASTQAVQVKFHPMVGLVEWQAQGPVDILPYRTYVSFDTLEAVYAALLNMRLAQRGVTVELQANTPQSQDTRPGVSGK